MTAQLIETVAAASAAIEGVAQRSFTGANGDTEHFFMVETSASLPFPAQLDLIRQRYAAALQALGLSDNTAVFRRIFLSDALNQAAMVRDSQPAADELAKQCRQLELFQTFFTTPGLDRETLSNAIDLWDAIPRYTVSRARMNKMRTRDGFLEALEVPFRYRGSDLVAVLLPARIKTAKGMVSYYPSAREEIVEHALRKLATEDGMGWYDDRRNRSGVRFSLYALRGLLANEGHALRYDEIVESLRILALSSIEIRAGSGESDEAFAMSNYLASLAGVKRKDYDKEPSARWVAQFHPLVTASIRAITYRQYNFRRLMRCRTQLARFLTHRLVLLYTQAAEAVPWDILMSTIKRDSSLLDGYNRPNNAVAALDDAMEELREIGVIASIERTRIPGKHNTPADVRYRLLPTESFVREQRSANGRRRLALAASGKRGE